MPARYQVEPPLLEALPYNLFLPPALRVPRQGTSASAHNDVLVGSVGIRLQTPRIRCPGADRPAPAGQLARGGGPVRARASNAGGLEPDAHAANEHIIVRRRAGALAGDTQGRGQEEVVRQCLEERGLDLVPCGHDCLGASLLRARTDHWHVRVRVRAHINTTHTRHADARPTRTTTARSREHERSRALGHPLTLARRDRGHCSVCA